MSVTKLVLNPTPVHRLSQRLKNAPRNRVTIRSGVRESLKCSGKPGQKRCGTYCKGVPVRGLTRGACNWCCSMGSAWNEGTRMNVCVDMCGMSASKWTVCRPTVHDPPPPTDIESYNDERSTQCVSGGGGYVYSPASESKMKGVWMREWEWECMWLYECMSAGVREWGCGVQRTSTRRERPGTGLGKGKKKK